VNVVVAPDPGPVLDIVQGLDGVPDYDELRAGATEAEVLRIRVLVLLFRRSFEDLKAAKRAAGKTREKADLEDLDATGR
jgi:hypothetical protein